MVPFKEWLEELLKRDIDDCEDVPAVKLLEFFEEFTDESLLLDVSKSLEAAPSIDYGELSEDLVTKYLSFQTRLT